MSELKTDPRVPSETLRMSAYYYSFEPTGNPTIDRILSAVACAGKAFHHTESWSEETEPYLGCVGATPLDWIQNAANDAANELRAQLAQAEPVAWHRNAKGSYHEMIFDAVRPEGEGWEPFYAAPPCAEPDRLAQCKADTQGPHWAQQAFAALGYLRDKMPSAEVTIVQRFLDAAAPESDKPHTDHPARHWDRTCPACNPAPESEGRK